ncbi:MAG: Chromosome (plasmid) partitioning protein ParB [uncultured Thermomicrobiales bacterium]|uniref:Chromosome (Plasmid) partitioning protein ParB n=1 Tax=uncultured Thermomicrobiales bacterium TaxID=1645740 RepID=A0A6J4UID5_9BACT|nr:MAG: Chromosome (plasmid) partitioning protein ParB [uncultured Thermomicrobiales bacterium]
MTDSPPTEARAASIPAGPRPGAGSGRRGGLGRGLGSLIPTAPVSDEPVSTRRVAIEAIEPNPFQPRTVLDPELLDALALSIRTHGVIQPLVVRHAGTPDRFTLIAGERRWRAARLAGLPEVPVVVMDAAPQAMLELALVENVVRADLSPLEEAAAYRQLIEDFGLSHSAVAERVGRSRASVTNTLRLLSAPERVQAALGAGDITEGHARALLGLANAADQLAALEVVLARGLTVRQTEDLVRRRTVEGPSASRQGVTGPERDPDEVRVEARFRGALGTQVSFKRRRGAPGGALTIHYASEEELDALYQRLVGEDEW